MIKDVCNCFSSNKMPYQHYQIYFLTNETTLQILDQGFLSMLLGNLDLCASCLLFHKAGEVFLNCR